MGGLVASLIEYAVIAIILLVVIIWRRRKAISILFLGGFAVLAIHLIRVHHFDWRSYGEDLPNVASWFLTVLGSVLPFIPELPEMLEHRRSIRWAVAIVFVVTGLGGIIVNHIQRVNDKTERDKQDQKLETVRNQNTEITNILLTHPSVDEATRRSGLLATLRHEYILSQPNIDPAILEGMKNPPTDWLNIRLRQLGENWSFKESESKPKPIIGPIPLPIAPAEKAHLEFSFIDDVDEDTDDPIKRRIVDPPSPYVTVHITFFVTGEVTARNGEIWIRICGGCRWAEEPEGFHSIGDAGNDRTMNFQILYPQVRFKTVELKIYPSPLPRYNSFVISGFYACENCPPIDRTKPDNLIAIYRPRK